MTVLIIGGAYQGKRKVAENLYADLPRIENLHEIVRKMLKEDKRPAVTRRYAVRTRYHLR